MSGKTDSARKSNRTWGQPPGPPVSPGVPASFPVAQVIVAGPAATGKTCLIERFAPRTSRAPFGGAEAGPGGSGGPWLKGTSFQEVRDL